MHDLKTLPAKTLLREYAFYDGRDHLQHLTRFLSRLGYVKVTRKHPTGRAITPDDVRHLLGKLLRQYPAYPQNRPPKANDYRTIKLQILEQYEDGGLR